MDLLDETMKVQTNLKKGLTNVAKKVVVAYEVGHNALIKVFFY